MPLPEIKKTCPECGNRMVVRANHETGHEFLGCSQYPECKYTEPMPEYMRMIRLGAPTLPGMDNDALG